MDKNTLRSLIRAEKRHFCRQELAEMSLSVVRRLLEHPRVQSAATVVVYYSLPDEVDTHTAVDTLYSSGKTVLLPVVTGEGLMELRRYTGSACLRAGAFGIMEPSGEPFTDFETIDLVIVPGMAFDASGNRLGRGKGYYDRFLPLAPSAYRLGVCFDFQKVTCVPASEHDIRMDEIL